MKPRRRWRSRESILKSIDRYHLKLESTSYEIMHCNQRISEILLTGGCNNMDAHNNDWRVRTWIDERERLERRIAMMNRKLERLKDRLAIIMTPQLPGLDNGDRSVLV